jgi:predicted lysophospholipase L1 biosynthesis ABC-type transport system permease subunit
VVLALTGTFAELAVLSTLAVAPLYMGGSVAAWLLARRGVAEAGAPLNFRWLASAMTVAAVSMLVLMALASRAEITGLVAVITASVLGYLLLRWKAAP